MTIIYEDVVNSEEALELIDAMNAQQAEWGNVLLETQKTEQDTISYYGGDLYNEGQKNIYFKYFYCEHLHNILGQYLAPVTQQNPTVEVTYTFYKWEKGSFLVMHDDRRYSFSATLYLNEEWQHDWGGYLFWLKNDDTEHVICPKLGRLAIFENSERHLVTPISMTAPINRLTVQIRGIKPENSVIE